MGAVDSMDPATPGGFMAFPSLKRPTSRSTLAISLAWAATAAVLVLPLPAIAEEDTDSPLRAGAWAAEFEIDPVLHYSLSYTSSATLAVKHHSSPGRALRLGASIGFSETEEDGVREAEQFDPYLGFDSFAASIDGHSESHDYSLFLHLVRERTVRDRVALFLEVGPSVRYSESLYHREWIYLYSPSRSTSDTRDVSRAAALDLNLGFEWFFVRRLSLGARYGAFADYSWGSRVESEMNEEIGGPGYIVQHTRTRPKRVDVSTNRATVTLAAYF